MSTDRILAAFLAAVPFAAWAMPLVAPWGLLLPIFAGGAASLLAARHGHAVSGTLIAVAAVVAMLLGLLPIPLATSVVAVAAVLPIGGATIAVAAAGMSLHMSAAATIEASLASWLAAFSLEATGPALLGTAVLATITWRAPVHAALAAVSAVALAWVAESSGLLPHEAMALVSIPLVAAVVPAAVGGRPASSRAALTICAISAATWVATPPRAPGDLHVVLPQAPDAYEATFFDRYAEALAIAGIDAAIAPDPSSIPLGATVLLPWVSVPLPGGDGGADGAATLGALARERGWTVLVAGEHDGYGDVDRRAQEMAGRPLLARDLTVPLGNSDASGPLRAAGLVPWPHDEAMNRGASVIPPGSSGRVLLSGDGWWTEHHLGEWLWTGDYVWRAEDRGGRIPLAAAYEDGAARWVVVGDNSPFLNRQVVANPSALLILLYLSSLYPAILADAFVLALVALACARHERIGLAIPVVPALVAMTAGACALAIATEPRPSHIQEGVLLGESGFDERNFNVALVEEPRLALGDWSLRRERAPISSNFNGRSGREVVFAHVEGEAFFGPARLSECWRLGSLQVTDGPYLMDAQACRVEGEAEVLAGSQDSATVVSVGNGDRRQILVLDTAFLSVKAPKANRDWLLSAMARREEAAK